MAEQVQCRTYFDEVAPQWDTLRQGFFSVAVRDRALAAAGITAGTTALDVGAGAGFISTGLVAEGVRVIAVDQSPRMLEELARQLPGVDCRVGEAERLPVADEAVDFVFANMYLHHVPDPAAAIREMVRVLRPGGGLVITDLDRHDFQFLRDEHHDRWLGFARSQLEKWLAAAGLREVAVGGVEGESCRAASCSCGGQADISIFLAMGRKIRHGA